MEEGKVLHAHSGRYAVLDREGNVVSCRARRRLRRPSPTWPAFPVPGDAVEWERFPRAAAGCGGVIEAVRPRSSEIVRRRERAQHVVVANLDQLVVVVSVCRPALDRGILDRLLATAERNRIRARICLHKIDLAERSAFTDVAAIYGAAGYPVLFTSAVSGEGIAALREELQGHVSAFMGPSGAGKSHLISALQPGLQLRTGMVSDKTGLGRHTTTRVDLHPTRFGALLADTPGIREFSLWRLEADELRDLFPEFRAVQEDCQFARCTHDHEPRCAVKSAVAAGRIDAGRQRSYLAILRELHEQGREWARAAGNRRRKEGASA